ncbi:hypothetical protein HpEKB20_09900 [Helicobacter pylori]
MENKNTQADTYSSLERNELHNTIWKVANELRGSVDGWDFKQYVLGILFYRYISENMTHYINKQERECDPGFDYANLSDEEAESAKEGLIEEKGFFIPPSALFCNVLKNAPHNEDLNVTLQNIFNEIEKSSLGFKSEENVKGLFVNGFFCKIKESLRRFVMLKELRQKRPLVHNITNYVVAQFVANGLLALGASPLMSDAIAEMQDLANISDALAINIGTLNERTILCAKEAIKHYKALNKPIVLDPVGCSASTLRHDTSLELLESKGISALRGNAAELGSLVGISCQSKGLDSHDASTPVEMVKLAAQKYSVVAVMTGKTDYVSDGKKVFIITGGSEYLALITGAGCLHTAACASFLSLKKDPLDSMVQLCALYKQAAFNAQKKVLENNGSNGSFLFYFLDALSLPIKLENSLIKEEL